MATRTLLVLVLVIVCASLSAMEEMEEPSNDNKYIITFPESIEVRVNQQENVSFPETTIEYGKFQCATRGGVLPLWLIDGVSATTTIKTKPGFENLTFSVHPLPENGTLTLLYVPGSVLTNNSVIRCAAFTATDGDVLEYSDIAFFTVYYCTTNCLVNTPSINITTADEGSSPTEKGAAICPYLIAGITVITLLLMLLMVFTMLMAVWCVWTKRKHLLGHQDAETQSNIYWNRSSVRILLKKSGSGQDMKPESELTE